MLKPTNHEGIRLWINDASRTFAGGFTIAGEDSAVSVQFTLHSTTQEEAIEEVKRLMTKVSGIFADCINGTNELVLKEIE